MKTYKKLLALSHKSHLLSSIQMLLEWDLETYMPKGSITARSSEIELLSSLVHKEKTSKTFGKTLNTLISLESGEILDPALSSEQKAAVIQMRRDYLLEVKLPSSFVKKSAQVISKASHVWQEAREKNTFSLFAPHLEKIMELSRQKAQYLGFKEHPYDALLDLYEPGMTTATLEPLFLRLKEKLSVLLKEIEKKPPISDRLLYGTFAKEGQMDFAQQILHAMGLDPLKTRLDLSAHPFCMGCHPTDVRMTTSIHKDNLLFCLFSVLHEAGHALYDLGLKEEHYGSPLGEAVSLGIHESQSRWWETRIGQSLSFWKYFYPKLQKAFPTPFENIDLSSFYQAINKVEPSLIRIEADEVTYNLHIILRFEIEKMLLEGSLKVKDLPEVWNAKMQELLHITPQTNKEGCLQDIHWACGLVGYFPTYTLGNLFASQFFAAFEKTHPHWETKIASGDFAFMREWLKENIHTHGRMYSSSELCKRICNTSLSEEPFIAYLTKKYGMGSS